MSRCTSTPISFIAGGDLTEKQYFFVRHHTVANTVVLQTTDGGGSTTAGVLQNDPYTAEAAAVLTIKGARTPVMCGGSFNPQDPISCDTAGKAVKAGTGDTVLGIAITAGAANTIADISLR